MASIEAKWPLFKPLTTIGADPQADICLPDCDGIVAHIQKLADGFYISGVSPRVPVLIEGKPIKKAQLIDGSFFQIGRHKLSFNPIAKQNQNSNPEMGAYLRLLNFSNRLANETELMPLLETLIDEVISLTKAEKGFLLLISQGKPTIRVARAMAEAEVTEDDLSDSIVKKTLETRAPQLISDALKHAEFSASKSVILHRLSSVMCVPLMHRQNLLGALYVGNNRAANIFDQTSLDVLTIFAAQAALMVQQAIEVKTLKENLEFVRFGDIIGTCPSMQDVFHDVDKVAKTNVNVLILGETGTGKELIARELHRRSERAGGPFVVINCGAIPEDLLESELFGHVRGAFTNAYQNRPGKFQAADGGTLFLDEIGDMPLHLQVKLLRALQENVVFRVGDNKGEEIDIRVVAATNRPLAMMVKNQQFREDLFYRLNVVQIELPPLKERGNDVLVIANYFLQKYAQTYHKPITGLTEKAQNALLNYSWPGNVRQLENRIKRAIVMCDATQIGPKDLDLSEDSTETILTLADALERFRKQYVQQALERNAGNRTKAARELGVDPRTVFRHLEDQKRTEQADA